jgi:hypothetical protein
MNAFEELEELKRKIEEHEKRIIELELLFKENTKNLVKEKHTSIGEFIYEMAPQNDIQKTLVIGYFLEEFESVSPFNVKDLESTFRKAKEPVPRNINFCVYRNIQKRFMMEAGEKDNRKAWILTKTGIDYVNNNLKRSK